MTSFTGLLQREWLPTGSGTLPAQEAGSESDVVARVGLLVSVQVEKVIDGALGLGFDLPARAFLGA